MAYLLLQFLEKQKFFYEVISPDQHQNIHLVSRVLLGLGNRVLSVKTISPTRERKPLRVLIAFTPNNKIPFTEVRANF